MINAFTLITPTFDPLGLMLHPTASLINHSCEPNAVVRCSSGTVLSVIPLRALDAGEEILVSYIDNNLPFATRQTDLQTRYHFVCGCPKCRLGTNTQTDLFLTELVPEQTSEATAIEARSLELMQSAETDTSISSSVTKLRHALGLMARTKFWPLHRHPNPAVRHALILKYIDSGQWDLAFAHSMIQYSETDEKLFPQRTHPLRLIHDWVLIRIIDQIIIHGRGNQDLLSFTTYKINFEFWSHFLMANLKALVDTSPPASHFWRQVLDGHGKIRGPSVVAGSHYPDVGMLGDEGMVVMMRQEQGKAMALIEDVLKMESEWLG